MYVTWGQLGLGNEWNNVTGVPRNKCGVVRVCIDLFFGLLYLLHSKIIGLMIMQKEKRERMQSLVCST